MTSLAYRPEIDGLRAIAVVAVVLYHADFSMLSGGFVGVDVFFVISGYLITSIIQNKLSSNTFSFTNFYVRRIKRLMPALYVVLAATFLASLFISTPPEQEKISTSIIFTALFLSNIYFWSESEAYFTAQADEIPLLHTWSLGIEEQFYIAFPLFMLLSYKLFKNNIKIVIFLCTAIAFFTTIALVEFGPMTRNTAFYLPITRSWELLAGSCLTYLSTPQNKKLSNLLSLSGLILILVPIFFYNRGHPFPGWTTAPPAIGTCLVIFSAGSKNLVGKALSLRYFTFIGVLSYTFYLTHQPLFAFFRLQFSPDDFLEFRYILIFAAFTLSYALHRWIEKPVLDAQGLENFPVRIFGTNAVIAAFFCLIGASGYLNSGFPSRVAAENRQLLSADGQASRDHVWGRLRAFSLIPFEGSGQSNALIIGDSYAGDFLNMIWESDYREQFNLSTHIITSRCGNVFVETDLSQHIAKRNTLRCMLEDRYDNPELIVRIQEADIVILVSRWLDWQVQYLDETVANIEALTDADVIVFGRKDFGNINIHALASLSVAERVDLENEVGQSSRDLNHEISRIIPEHYVDPIAVFCPDYSCPVFTANGDLISFDGGHLTPAGAVWAARRLPDLLVPPSSEAAPTDAF